ncbi:vomeronasal type-2 receptor 26-like [Hyperolius riggenbachi]|uniref:vomeronasal type-2 receptor 26-like n=1 Tax=Hyperolius riggenbachi TaxID=752182 RepID=UPI0035A3CDB8
MYRAAVSCHLCAALICVLLLCVTPCKSQIQASHTACRLDLVSAIEDYEYVQDGDIIIGGIFTVNYFMTGLERSGDIVHSMMLCLRPVPLYYKYLLVFLFAVNEINKDPDLLPNVTLGYQLYDSCADNRKAVKSVLQILSGPGQTVPNYSCRRHRKVAGFIGDQGSVTTVSIAQLLAIYRHTQISHGATSNFLNDRNIYPTFFRTVRGDEAIYSTISSLVQFFGWTWVGVISSDDDSGNEETQLLTKHLTVKGICVAYMVKIKYNKISATDIIHRTIIEIIQKSSAQVIILCGTYSSYMADLLVAIRPVLRDKTLVFGPTFALNTFLMEHYMEAFNGTLAVQPSNLPIPDMRGFFDEFTVANHPEDMLLRHIWRHNKCCSLNNAASNKLYAQMSNCTPQNCSGTEMVTDFISFQSRGLTDRVYNAVYSLAHAIDKMKSSPGGGVNGTRFFSDQQRLNYWMKAQSLSVRNFVFDQYGELVTPFKVGNWRTFKNGSCIVRIIGQIQQTNSHQAFSIRVEAILWKHGMTEVPRSQCSEKCLPGSRKVTRSGIHSCCYDCVECSAGEISNVTDSENCHKCQYDEWPNEKKDRCVPKVLDFLSYTGDIIVVFFSVSSGGFSLITMLILGIFISHRDTAIVKANNRNLSFILLLSIMLSFLCVFLFLGRPVDVSCLLRQICFGILFTAAVSCILGKTIMVYIAFKATKLGSLWQRWIGTNLAKNVAISCSSIQVIICVSWLSISPPFQEMDFYSSQGKIIIQCNEGSLLGFYSVLGYMGLLAAVSFLLAFMVRTLPDIFNEAKYITFSMLVFCSVWIAMIPAYLSTRGKYMVAVEIFAILTSSGGLLACIFLPKCFIIFWRPELNTKACLLERRNWQ